MAVLFHILVILWTTCGQTRAATSTDNSSVSSKGHGHAESGYAVPRTAFNNENTSIFYVSEITRTRVPTTASKVKAVAADTEKGDVAKSKKSPTSTEAAGNIIRSDDVGSETVPGETVENTMYPGNVGGESVPGETVENIMYTGNVGGESFPGQAAENTMHTGNAVSENVPGETVENITGNAGGESVPGQAADNTMRTGNAGSGSVPGQSDGSTVYTSNVDSDIVLGQAAGKNMYTGNVGGESVPGQADNTMRTGNAGSGSVPGQSDGSTVYTSNVDSDIVLGQAAGKNMYTGNVGSESVPAHTADSTVYTGNVGSVMGGTIPADNVADESAHGPAADFLTVRGRTRAMESGLHETVTAPSESMDTGRGRTGALDSGLHETFTAPSESMDTVRGRTRAMESGLDETVTAPSESMDTVRGRTSALDSGLHETVTAPSESVDTVRSRTRAIESGLHETFTAPSENMDTVDTASESVLTPNDNSDEPGNSPVTWAERCEVALCQTGTGYFVINTTACVPNDSMTMDTSVPSTVEIMTDGKPATDCQWKIFVPQEHFVNLTIDQLVLDATESDRTQTLEFDVVDDNRQSFDISVLRNRSVTFTSSSSLFFRFRDHDLHFASSITFHFLVQRGAPVMDLPVVQLTNTVGYVTSPGFDGLDRIYPKNYDGLFHLQVLDFESVLISFTHFVLEESSSCSYDYLDFNVTAFNETWRKCGIQEMSVRVYRSSINLFFHSDYSFESIGFKMMYAVIPRSQEPERLSDNLYNCSVPHFHSFKPVLSCNMLTECQGQEDEKGCGYQSNDCGEGGTDAGATKCYRFVRLGGRSMTWSDANYECNRRDHQKLVTLATPAEVTHFRHVMSSVGKPRRVYVGAQLVDKLQDLVAMPLYRHLWRWVDGRTAFFLDIIGSWTRPVCAHYSPGERRLMSVDCKESFKVDLVCEFDKRNQHSVNSIEAALESSLSIIDPEEAVWNVSVVQCPPGHVTRDFLSCDRLGQCGAKLSVKSCHTGSVTIAMFECERSRGTVPYTLVCDHIQHCADNTDEDFCQFSPCPFRSFRCGNGQCVAGDQLCDGKSDCYDGSDEVCSSPFRTFLEVRTLPPAVLDVDGTGMPFLRHTNDSQRCPLTHFQCARGFCLPVYLRCNGVDDCPSREDEAACGSYTCPGYYRCRGSKVCLHPAHVCDGLFQCPQYDDELLCEMLPCPDVCQCQGLAYVCSANFSPSPYPALRYLDASGSGMTPSDVTHNHFLIRLRLSDCRINTQPALELPNLRHLDLSGNELTHIDMQHFHSLNNLRVLVLSGNPLSAITYTESSGPDTMVLHTIDLSGTRLDVFNGSALAGCPNLRTLIMTRSEVTTITKEGFRSTPLLENLDVRGSPLKDFPSDLLRGLVSLKVVLADNYKLCCEAVLPEHFDLSKCHADPQDLLASCEDLLKSNVYRVFLWIFASLAVVGNVGSFVARLYLGSRGAGLGSFNMFVASLSIADFCMGVYLAIIGVADQIYRGEYLWHGDQWKQSVVCMVAGFLSLVSSEVSAFIICLITLDRFLVLCFPFSRLHFSRSSALVACVIVWMVGIALAIVPLLPMTSHWEFYSQTGICIPLPFTTGERFQGYDYSFSVMLILNLVLFLLIAVGQAFIYWSVRSNSISSSKKMGSRDATIARRLTTIVVSDFLCWFPIGLLGLLASTGTPIPGELNVAVAIFVLPFNSALNPFLYTFNVLREKRLKAREAYLLKRLETRLHTEQTHGNTALKASPPVNKVTAMRQVERWLCEQVFTKEDVLSC